MDQMQRRHHHNNNNHPCNVDECAVNFAFLGPFLFSGNGLLLSTKGSRFQAQEERLLKTGGSGTGAMLEGSDSVSPVSSLLKNSSVVHVASFGEHVLVVFRRNQRQKSGTGDQEEPFVEDDSFDFLEWFKETTSFADFVVLKMNTSGAEMKSLSL
ncbi:hypothetical protein DY000_02056090 [Brassica cretica]|uniref:Uncharacterized protein n=1 Tax=Brassica cretica TaxID=69181 RepID=A0ABQ7A827_BRACR|nr:hypothetical protein DY000_02056090 [Brassica cretica]